MNCRGARLGERPAADTAASTTSIKMCVSNLAIPNGGRELTINREFARSFGFAQDDNE
jgi:hypothetical protein